MIRSFQNGHQNTFEAIKQIMTSMNCLISINYNLGENIYVTTNTSLTETGIVLSVRKS